MTREEELTARQERARDKVRDVRLGRTIDGPAPRVWLAAAFYGLATGMSLALMTWMLWPSFVAALRAGAPVPKGMVLVLVLDALLVVALWRAWRNSLPTTPRAVLVRYYAALASGRPELARRYVLAADFDDLERRLPMLRFIDEPKAYRFSFRAGYREYWRQILHARRLGYCVVWLTRVRVEELAPDVVAINYRIRLFMNTKLVYVLALLCSLPLAVLVDFATQMRERDDVRRMAIRVDGQWKLLSGGWDAPEEEDASWLPAPPDEHPTPYRTAPVR